MSELSAASSERGKLSRLALARSIYVAQNRLCHCPESQLNQLNGATDYDDPTFTPIQSTEYNSEIYYGIHVTDWLTVRPNVQYIVHPGGTDHVDNALVAGIKLQTKF